MYFVGHILVLWYTVTALNSAITAHKQGGYLKPFQSQPAPHRFFFGMLIDLN